jgi:glutamine amidotransferase
MSERLIHVVDYGAGNVGSVLNMIRRIGGEGCATSDPEALVTARKILLPGVGSFDNAMRKLRDLGLAEALVERAAAGIPVLGICLGMQLLGSRSEEGNLPGLGVLAGVVRKFRLEASHPGLKVPHMGWNIAKPVKASPLLQGLESGARYYFVHSYYFDCLDPSDRLLETSHGVAFTSGIERANVMGVQFHPEKSHRFGSLLLKNFSEI